MTKKGKISRSITAAGLLLVTVTGLGLCLKNFNVESPKNLLDFSNNNTLPTRIGMEADEYSNGYDTGGVFSIDGQALTEKINLDDMEYTVGKYGFSSLLGAEGVGESSILNNDCYYVLHADSHPSNQELKRGDEIVLTISANGQRKAVELLEQFYSNNCKNAQIAVVLRGGAVLVSAGTNEYSAEYALRKSNVIAQYFPNDVFLSNVNEQTINNYLPEEITVQNMPEDMKLSDYIPDDVIWDSMPEEVINQWLPDDVNRSSIPSDFGVSLPSEAYTVGSTAKPVFDRTLLLNDDFLDEETSLFNPAYEDFSEYQLPNGKVIHNWDYGIPEYYSTALEYSQFSREIDLKHSLLYSSNVYILRHAFAIGLDKAFQMENDIFNQTSAIKLDTSAIIPAVTVEESRLPYFFWGQDYQCSLLRLCSQYNQLISGECHIPFYTAAVYAPDKTLLYTASEHQEEAYSFSVEDDDILVDAMKACAFSYMQDTAVEQNPKYAKLLEDGQLLAKSGTAEVTDDGSITNNSRMLTLLDENGRVICSAGILVTHSEGKNIDNGIMFSTLLQVLEAANVI